MGKRAFGGGRTRRIDDLGVVHAAAPVEPGDLVTLEHGPPLRIVAVLAPPPGSGVVPPLAETARLPAAAS